MAQPVAEQTEEGQGRAAEPVGQRCRLLVGALAGVHEETPPVACRAGDGIGAEHGEAAEPDKPGHALAFLFAGDRLLEGRILLHVLPGGIKEQNRGNGHEAQTFRRRQIQGRGKTAR